MLKYFIILLLVLAAFYTKAQVKLLSFSQLESRMTNGKDTTYVVNFWATWCAPCVEELPAFEKLNSENGQKPLKVILMSVDLKNKLKSEVVPFVAKNKIKAEVYVVNEPDQQKFKAQVNESWSGALPSTLM